MSHIETETRRLIRSPSIFDEPQDALDLVHEKIGERDFSGKTMKIALFTSDADFHINSERQNKFMF